MNMLDSRRKFEAEEFVSRQQKTRKAMINADVELMVVYDPANMNWLTGYDCWSFYVHQCLVISTKGDLFWFG